MEYFEKIQSGKISGYNEIKPINDENYKEYIKELISLNILNNDVQKLLVFLSNKIEDLNAP